MELLLDIVIIIYDPAKSLGLCCVGIQHVGHQHSCFLKLGMWDVR